MKCIIAKMDSEGEGLTHSAESLSLYGFNYRTQGIGGRKLAVDVLPEDKMAFRLWLESNRGHGMPGVRQWLHQRFGSAELIEASSKEKQQSMPAVITPDTVPQFVIPFGFSDTSSAVSNGLISPTVESSSGYLRYENQNVRSSPVVEENRVSKSSKGSFESLDFELQFPDHNSLNSTPSSPIGTNDDPFSAAAVSLPHLRTLTSFGFTTVLESPHTRRKESLLLGSTSMADIKELIKRKMLAAGNRSLSAMQYTEKLKESDLYGPVVPNAYRSLSSSSISLKSEPLSESPPTSIWTRNTAMSRQYQRRRSSDKSTTNQEYGSTEVSQNKMSKEEAQGLATLGEIKFSIVYLKKMSSLKLSVIKAEQLAKDIKDKSQLNMTVKSTLLPDKSQRHETMSIRATHDPQYNQVFAFKDVSLCDIETKALRLRVFNKPSSRKKDLLGEVILPLEHLGLRHEEEVRMWRDLEPQQESECRGFINISMRFEPREDRLSVTVIEARGLPKSIITGLPDPYICINVTQDGKTFIKKQTRTRKSTDHPVFKETFVFSISPKVDCIKYTAIKIRVMSKVKLASDATMGVLTFGYGSTEEHQIIHWNKVLSNTNNDIQQWHTLCKPTA